MIKNKIIKIWSLLAADVRIMYGKCPLSAKIAFAAVVAVAVVFLVITISTRLPALPEAGEEAPLGAAAVSPAASSPAIVTAAPEPPDGLPDEPEPTPEPPRIMLPHMEALYNENSDITGWLKIEGTVLDYPVMYTPDDPGLYLYRNFEKKDDPTEQGSLFIDENCSPDPRSANLIIHGHNMKNGTMFSTLLKYKDEAFYKKHPTFEYTTLYETEQYEIVAVFLSRVFRKSDTVFKFYQFYDAQTEEEYDYFIDNIKKLQLYDTGVTASFGQPLITLSTCEYSQENGRMVIVGRRVD